MNRILHVTKLPDALTNCFMDIPALQPNGWWPYKTK